MDDVKLESMILNSLSLFTPIWSNELHRKLGVNKADYTRIKNKMIEERWIRSEKREGRHYLTRIDFESSTFDRNDWNKYTLINCNSALDSLKTQRPLFRVTKKKVAKIKRNAKMDLDMLLHELDRFLIVHSRLVYAQSLGLIRSGRAKVLQNDCITTFHQVLNRLFRDHGQFKKEILEYAQSQIKTLQFKI
jgi:hypothetical protein